MLTHKKQFKTVDEYIKTFPNDMRAILEKMRQVIRKVAPQAVEEISYQMPAFKLNGKYFVAFAAWKNHLAVYPVPAGNPAFQKELAPYKGGKGTVRFPLGKPIPYKLVRKIVIFLMKEKIQKKR